MGLDLDLFRYKKSRQALFPLWGHENFSMFVLSKLMSAITHPVFWLALWWCVALCLLSLSARWRRSALRMLWAGWVFLGLLGFEALPQALLRPLENRYWS